MYFECTNVIECLSQRSTDNISDSKIITIIACCWSVGDNDIADKVANFKMLSDVGDRIIMLMIFFVKLVIFNALSPSLTF